MRVVLEDPEQVTRHTCYAKHVWHGISFRLDRLDPALSYCAPDVLTKLYFGTQINLNRRIYLDTITRVSQMVPCAGNQLLQRLPVVLGQLDLLLRKLCGYEASTVEQLLQLLDLLLLCLEHRDLAL